MNYDNFLELFVSKDKERDILQMPCLVGEFVYAANGHVAIRIPQKQLSGSYLAIEKFPNVQKVFDDNIDRYPCNKIIDIGELRKLYHNLRKLPKHAKCKSCEGSGVCICLKCYDEHPCGICNGSGYSNKIIDEVISENEDFQLGEAVFSAKVFEPIYNVCDKLNSDLQIFSNDEAGGTVIQSQDILMIVMPLRLSLKSGKILKFKE